MSQFKLLLKHTALLTNLQTLRMETPTPIQERAIPVILSGEDVLGIAQTGTGKTAAYLLPLIQMEKVTLVLVPTRELALQVDQSVKAFSEGLPVKSVALFGGVDQGPQVQGLREKPHFIVATPGRLLDLINQKQVPLSLIETLVLDEADQMLDMGFIDDILTIRKFLTNKNQTLFFSATIPQEVLKLSEELLRNPTKIEASANSSTVQKISQKVIFCRKDDKFQLLRKTLKEERQLVVVFTKTKDTADKVKEYLRTHRLASVVLHGDKSQSERERSLALFRDGSMKILIATDIAARGIDVPGISHVVNFEMPLDPENYVHRIGRTGRNGEDGIAISFCDETERSMLQKIEGLIKLKLPVESFKGSSEPKGVWLQDGPIIQKTAPTPGVSQEKRAFVDHSKRQGDRPVSKTHPGFKHKKKKR